MTIKIDLSKVQTEQLDATSLNWISKFAHTLENHNGTILELRSTNLVQQVVSQVRANDSAELRDIYEGLKSSLRAQVKREPSSFEKIEIPIKDFEQAKGTSDEFSNQA